MAEVMDHLQIYGFSRDDEAVYLASLLTGDPCLLICAPGAAKTTLMRKTARALGANAAIFNVAEAQFEDIIGFLDVGALGKGEVKYIETPLTIWGKEFVGMDEVNRPRDELGNKWLDFQASGMMMGKFTGVQWRVGAMNPFGTQGTNTLGEAQIGRFSSFLFLPEFLTMSGGEQEAVIKTTTDANLLAFKHWSEDKANVGDNTNYELAGGIIKKILRQAAEHYVHLLEALPVLPRFLSRFAVAISTNTAGQEDGGIRMDGRRAGMVHRLILAIRAVEVARANVLRLNPKSFEDCVVIGLRYGIPVGINSESGRNKDALKKLEEVALQMMSYLRQDKDTQMLEVQFELLTTTDIFRKAQLLLEFQDRLDRIVKSAAWTRITSAEGFDAALVGFIANQIEIVKPNTLPPDVMDGLTRLMNGHDVVPRTILLPPHLKDVEQRLRDLAEQKGILPKLIAAHYISRFVGTTMGQRDTASLTTEVDGLEAEIATESRKAGKFAKVVEEMLKPK